MSEEKQQERKLEPLAPHGLHTAEHRRVTYFAITPEKTTVEDALRPEFWAHEAAKLKPRDRVEIHAYDGTWFMEVLVTDVSRAYARVKPIIGPIMLTTVDVAQTQAANYELMLRGPRKWSVVHKVSRDVLVDGLETKDAAAQWLKDNPDKLTV